MPLLLDADAAVAHLRRADPVMGYLADAYGPLQLRARNGDPFLALARAIVFQQLSGRAASTIFNRLAALMDRERGCASPEALLALTDDDLRAAGISRQKSASLRDLAGQFASGEISLEGIESWGDEEVIAHLTRVRGIGRWTAEMYLIFDLGRADVLPVNDLGINRAIMQLYGLPILPKPHMVLAVGRPWHPWASAASWLLWRSQDTPVPAAPTDW